MKSIILIIFIYLNIHAKMLIPLYSEPFSWNYDDYKKGDVVILNPDNGIGDSYRNDYDKGIWKFKERGIKAIGYIATGYGKKEVSLIKQEIYEWKNTYPEIKGVFFDETSIDPQDISKYREISSYARKFGFYVVMNAGIAIDPIYADKKMVDIIITYENNYTAYKQNRAYKKNEKINEVDFAILIHEVDNINKNLIDEVYHDFQYVYLTEDNDGNPWDSVSQVFLKARSN